MPVFTLTATAELESIASVAPAGSDSAGGAFQWRVLFACGSCR